MLKEFREFILKGNVLDLAIGVIIGAAFGKIVDSLVNTILMPVVSLVAPTNFQNLFLVLKEGKVAGPYVAYDDAVKAGAVAIGYGKFLTEVVNFVIIGFVLFLIVKAANRFRREHEPEAPAAPAGPTQEELLVEIRDLLAKR